MRGVALWIVGLSVGLVASAARATYSIAAVDQSTDQVGGAVTSCVGTLDVGIVYGSAPGFGVVHAQALLDQRGRPKSRAIELLEQGLAPEQIIAQITQLSFDSMAASRQYGVVDLMGRSSGFTGDQAQAYKQAQQGHNGSFFYSVQGNILTSQKVLDQAAAAFEAQGCDLAERLMLALEAGAMNGEGDSRCTDQGIPSDSAFIEVDRPGEAAGSYLKLSVMGTAPQSSLKPLRVQFDAWRKTHPCMVVASDAGVPQAGSGMATGGASAGQGASAAGRSGQGGGGAAGGTGAAGASPAVGSAGAGGGSAAASGAAGRMMAAAGVGATATLMAGTGARIGAAAPLGAAGLGGAATPEQAATTSAANGCNCGLSSRAGSGGLVRGVSTVMLALLSFRRRRRLRRRAHGGVG
jgi:uncharacterized Ntn-hydrolase superfamily protein